MAMLCRQAQGRRAMVDIWRGTCSTRLPPGHPFFGNLQKKRSNSHQQHPVGLSLVGFMTCYRLKNLQHTPQKEVFGNLLRPNVWVFYLHRLLETALEDFANRLRIAHSSGVRIPQGRKSTLVNSSNLYRFVLIKRLTQGISNK